MKQLFKRIKSLTALQCITHPQMGICELPEWMRATRTGCIEFNPLPAQFEFEWSLRGLTGTLDGNTSKPLRCESIDEQTS